MPPALCTREPNTAIKEVNIGIDQVSQVIQHNSAMAQQSAAAAQEMSSQSIMLQSMIARFKLKNASASLVTAKKSAPDAANLAAPHTDIPVSTKLLQNSGPDILF